MRNFLRRAFEIDEAVAIDEKARDRLAGGACAVAFGAHYPAVFRVAGTAAFMTFGLGPLVNVIWKGLPASVVLKETFDGLIYALLTAGTFAWLWPR